MYILFGMELKEYIKWKRLSTPEVLEALDITRQHLWNITNGHPTGRKLALKIIRWSGGQVRFEDMWDLGPERNL